MTITEALLLADQKKKIAKVKAGAIELETALVDKYGQKARNEIEKALHNYNRGIVPKKMNTLQKASYMLASIMGDVNAGEALLNSYGMNLDDNSQIAA